MRILGENGQHSEVIAATGVCKSTVDATINLASATGLSWPLSVDFDDQALERHLYLPAVHPAVRKLSQPDWQALLMGLPTTRSKACRKATSRRVQCADLPEEVRFRMLGMKSKYFIGTIKRIAYRAETAMAIVSGNP